MTDNNEVLELAKKCGAKIFHKKDNVYIVIADNRISGNATQFIPKFSAALEEKYQAKVALDSRLICAMETRLLYVCDAVQNGREIDLEKVKGWRAMCRHCHGQMKPGQAIKQTYTGLPDFPGDTDRVTLSPGGPGVVVECLKCEQCGWSVQVEPSRK